MGLGLRPAKYAGVDSQVSWQTYLTLNRVICDDSLVPLCVLERLVAEEVSVNRRVLGP